MQKKTNYFINLTNHPTSTWLEPQLVAAQAIGELIDIPFPEVPADATKEDVAVMALDMVDRIKDVTGGHPCTVHVMGEMTLTYALVKELKALGYRCVASTSKRLVEMLEDGSKNVRFEFCQFREY